MSDLPSLSLSQLAKRANEAAAASETYAANTLQKAVEAGEALLEAKTRCEHGDWLPWIKSNFAGTARWAQKLMRIAEDGKRIEGAISIKHALRIVSDPDSDELEDKNEPSSHLDSTQESGDESKNEPNEERENADEEWEDVDDDSLPVEPWIEQVESQPEPLSEIDMALKNAAVGKEIVNAIRAALKLVKNCPEAPGTEGIINRRRRITDQLKNAAAEVSVHIPKCVCPRCNGDGCPQCGNHGWVNAILAKELSA